MGVVYKAVDPLIERTVALKTVKLDLSTTALADFEERFYREARSAGRLNHPNIVTIYDVGKTDSAAYMAMEFMEGRLLKDVLDAHTALSFDQIVDIAAQIADGLAYAHEHEIVHRDIKPANIMLVRGDLVKIMDFGIAQMPSGARTHAGAVLGSPKYMAPEQVLGNTLDGRSDVFALGVILYEMLTGESPFDGDNINTIMYRIVNETPIPAQSLSPRIPEVFDRIIGKALAKQPDQRYQDARALAHDLRHYQDTEPPAKAAPGKMTNKVMPGTRQSGIGEATVMLSAGATLKPAKAARQPAGLKTPAASGTATPFLRSKQVIYFALIIATALVLIAITRHDKKPDTASRLAPASAPAPASVPAPAPTSSATVHDAAAPVRAKMTHLDAMHTQASHHREKEKGSATLEFAVLPWGEIYIDGKKAGITPPVKKLTIAAGRHKIEIRNLNFTRYSKTTVLKADSRQTIHYTFQ